MVIGYQAVDRRSAKLCAGHIQTRVSWSCIEHANLRQMKHNRSYSTAVQFDQLIHSVFNLSNQTQGMTH
jgi:hypothetical protein